MQQLCAWAGIPVKIFDDALKIFATGVFLSVTCGFRLSWSVIVCGALMVGYSFFGGLWALVVTDYVQFLMKSLAIVLLIPLAFHAAGGFRLGLSGLPPGFLLPVNKPYGWTYIIGFTLLMMLSYNASWSLAQKYYSVTDEKAAAKAAYLSAGLNFFGAPLMIFPGILARHFLPGLETSGHSADTYVLILAKLLPEGMIGIILAAMLSATMAAVSADFNAIASVLTQDIYRPILDKEASEEKLLYVGRFFTVALGTITTLLCLWIVFSQQQALFNLMVTVFGVFLAPTLMPILAALVTKKVTTAGALCGFTLGLSSSVVLLTLKMRLPALTHLPGGSFQFEGLSLLLNLGFTLLGLVLGSILGKREADEAKRAEEFHARLLLPVSAPESGMLEPDTMGLILPISTFFVAVLVGVAGAISDSSFAHIVDGGTAIIFAALSCVLFYVQRKRHKFL